MEQHAVPQPITSYEFRLVGDMTLKQFGKLALGVILALIVYWINPAPGILKWTLIIFFTSLGLGMAFLPFQGRPLDVWILSFFRRIYSPTQYIWRMGGKMDIKPSYEQVIEPSSTYQVPIQPQQSQPTISPPRVETNNNQHQTTYNKQVNSLNDNANESISEPKITPYIVTSDTDLWHKGKPKPKTPVPTETKSEDAIDTLYQSPPPSQNQVQFNQSGEIPQKPKSSIDRVTIGSNTIYSADTPNTSNNNQQTINNEHKSVPPTFNPSLIIPTLPNIPNILGGFVKDTNGMLVEGAIIEVRDTALNPVRAFKTNKIGQFQIATPLPDGVYEIETEKDGLSFDIIKVEMKGEVLSPFEIIAKQSVISN